MASSADEALARARAVAARLTGALSNGGSGDAAGGKRKRGWGDEDTLPGFSGASTGNGDAMSRRKIYMPQNPDINYLGLVIGPRGATQKRLIESSGVKSLNVRGRGSTKGDTSGGDDDEMHVLLEGSEESIYKCAHELKLLFDNPEEALRLKGEQLRSLAELNHGAGAGAGDASGGGGGGLGVGSVVIKVPHTIVGFVIGKGGENISRMQGQTGGRIQVQKENEMQPGETMRNVTLTGTPEAIAELRQRVEEIVQSKMGGGGGGMGGGAGGGGGYGPARGPPRADNLADHAFLLKLPVPHDKVGIIIGKGGQTIKSIQDRTRTTIQIPQEADPDNPSVRTIGIGAETQEAAEAAVMEIHQALQQFQQQGQQQQQQYQTYGGGGRGGGMNQTTITVPVPDDRAGGIIGKGGSTIKDLERRFSVKITIPQTAEPGFPPMRMVLVAGSPQDTENARGAIQGILDGYGNGQRGGGYGGGGMGGGMGLYGGGGYGGYHQQHQHQHQGYGYGGGGGDGGASYGQGAYGQPQQAAAPTSEAAAAPHDPTQYYTEYWTYAAHYGEKAARLYYQAWSPPEGTPPPPGVVVAPDIDLSSAAEAATGNVADSSVTATVAAAGAGAANSSGRENTHASSASAVAESSESESAAPAEEDPMIAYRKQYREWWLEHGKASGAPENAPE